jgi:hypothetical protein
MRILTISPISLTLQSEKCLYLAFSDEDISGLEQSEKTGNRQKNDIFQICHSKTNVFLESPN